MPRGNPEARKALALLDAERRRSFLPYSPGFGAPCRSLRCFLIDQRGLPSHPIARAREETRSPRSRPRSDPARPSTSGSLCEAVPGRRRCRIPRDGQAVETAKNQSTPRTEPDRSPLHDLPHGWGHVSFVVRLPATSRILDALRAMSQSLPLCDVQTEVDQGDTRSRENQPQRRVYQVLDEGPEDARRIEGWSRIFGGGRSFRLEYRGQLLGQRGHLLLEYRGQQLPVHLDARPHEPQGQERYSDCRN